MEQAAAAIRRGRRASDEERDGVPRGGHGTELCILPKRRPSAPKGPSISRILAE